VCLLLPAQRQHDALFDCVSVPSVFVANCLCPRFLTIHNLLESSTRVAPLPPNLLGCRHDLSAVFVTYDWPQSSQSSQHSPLTPKSQVLPFSLPINSLLMARRPSCKTKQPTASSSVAAPEAVDRSRPNTSPRNSKTRPVASPRAGSKVSFRPFYMS
jgi:hypothetical protein